MKQAVSERQYQEAIARGQAELAEPHAIEASFDVRTHMLSIRFTNGLVVGIDARRSPSLSAHSGVDLAQPYVTPGGDALIFDRAEVSVSVPGLLAQFIPEDAARRKVASVMGKTRSEKKSLASKANGAKGGRPRASATPRT